MSVSSDIEAIIGQEKALAFARFDEEIAFAIGSWIRNRSVAEDWSLVADVRLWDRPLFYCALPGSTCDNAEWVRRKTNVVRTLHRSSYRAALMRTGESRSFPPDRALSPADYVLAGGSFPVRVEGAGIIGAITVSGLPERQDHGLVVEAICVALNYDYGTLALPEE